MSIKLQYFSICFFLFTLVLFIPSVSRVQGIESEAITRVNRAEDSLEAAYLLVLKAERAGGDVSELVALLNTALERYSEAERALEYGDYETAALLALKVVETSNVILDADVSLMFVVVQVEEEAFRNQLFLSFGSVFFIILFGFLGWRLFKGYYVRRTMGLRSVDVVDES
ncbi:MAG: hypothetical protein ACFFDN_02370 [Candidatus Hodarchaeota archaeon]